MTICIKGVRKESMQREYGIKFKLISIHNVMLFFYIIVMVIGESNFMQYGFYEFIYIMLQVSIAFFINDVFTFFKEKY